MARRLFPFMRSALALAAGLAANVCVAQAHKQSFLSGTINEAHTVKVTGNVRPEVTAENDRGPRADSAPMTGLQLVLHRSDENQAAFESYLADLHNPQSPNFHKWLSNAEIGTNFGPSASDLAHVSQWLTDKGFSVNSVSPDGLVVEFNGTAGLVHQTFHTAIHDLVVNGKAHFANVSDPEIPEGLAPVVSGIASLHNFMPHALSHPRTQAAVQGIRQGNGGSGYNYLSAADLQTIYNFNPLLASGITGKGQTVVLIEDTDQYSLGDWQVFRKVFGLNKAYPYGTLTQAHPAGSNTCTAPGANGDDAEAAIDVDWATAAAPNAALINAACADTAQFGGFLALANLLQSANPPRIVSISYGETETALGATENLYIRNLYATAAAEGVSVFVSSGDEGAASADANRSVATHGIQVSGFTSTPYNISVGGTDYGNIALHSQGTYFSDTNLPNFRTALSYIPEIPWNDSCAGELLTDYYGYPRTGPGSICNATSSLHTTASGSGGPSGCATGATATRDVVSGTCKGYTKPLWQQLVGVPSDGVRDVPDVSLMASNGFWGEYYATCISDPAGSFTPCTGDPSSWAGFGGTSISSPIWAGIQALVNQSTGTIWGNSNTVLYALANQAYGDTGNASCNSSLGNQVGSNCVFYDVTQGDMAVNCTGSFNCYISGGTYGVLSTSDTTLAPAYRTTVGYDFATGIGTTNTTNLVNAWTRYVTVLATAR